MMKLYDDQRQAMAALVEREGAVVIHDLVSLKGTP